MPLLPPFDPKTYNAVRSSLYLSKFPDKPLQIRQHFEDLPGSYVSAVAIPSNAYAAVVHSFQFSTTHGSLANFVSRFGPACSALAIKIGRPITMEVLDFSVVAHFGPTGNPRDKIIIDVEFKYDQGLLDIVYRTPPPAPILPPITI
jgi:hypothetical protein